MKGKELTIVEKIEIEKIVEDFIIKHNIDTSEPVDIVKLARNLDFMVASFELPETEDGFVLIDKKTDKLFGLNTNKIIGVNENRTYEEKRFIVAHELGHYILHNKGELIFAHRENVKGKNIEENDADYFAACILMYNKLFIEAYKAIAGMTNELDEKISFLSRYFKVPEQSVLRRINEAIVVNDEA